MVNRCDITGGINWIFGESPVPSQDLIDTNYSLISSVMQCQNYFETLKHAGDVDNEDYLIADIFTDEEGVKDTINTGQTSSQYGGGVYSNTVPSSSSITDYSGGTIVSNGVNDPDRAFNNNSGSRAVMIGGTGRYLGKTFSSTFIKTFTIRSSFDDSVTRTFSIETYDGSTWSSIGSVTIDNGTTKTLYHTPVYQECQGIRINCGDTSGYTVYFYNMGEADEFDLSSDVETNDLIVLDGTEKGIIVFDKSYKETNTNIDVDVSDGSTTLSTQNVREYIDISSLSSGNLSIDFNLSSTDDSISPALYGYGLVIIK